MHQNHKTVSQSTIVKPKEPTHTKNGRLIIYGDDYVMIPSECGSYDIRVNTGHGYKLFEKKLVR